VNQQQHQQGHARNESHCSIGEARPRHGVDKVPNAVTINCLKK
jgi:hypothetical protein